MKLTKKIQYLICFLLIGIALSCKLMAAEEEPKSKVMALTRDPMIPTDMSIFEAQKTKAVVKRSPFKIQGVGHSDKGSYVIIGGKVYREGQTRGDVTVVKIRGSEVDILSNGTPETLQVSNA